MGVPFLDLKRIHLPINKNLVSAFEEAINASDFINGRSVENFETNWAKYCGTNYCVGISDGTAALSIALRALGIQEGDKVIIPSMTFFATAEAVANARGVPVVVDVDDHGLLDLELTAKAIEETKARFLIPVHLYGQILDPDALIKIKEKYNLLIVEDSCQAHGCRKSTSLRAGNIADAAAFSFYPGKNLGALGDAGAITTNSESVYDKCKALREHGQAKKNNYKFSSSTHRLDAIQARFLDIKLPHLDSYNLERTKIASYYFKNLKTNNDLKILNRKPKELENNFHLFVILTTQREALSKHLNEHGISFGMHYPVSMADLAPLTKAKIHSFEKGNFIAKNGLSLPIFPAMTELELNSVCQTINQFFNA